jgi:hypothetical protein
MNNKTAAVPHGDNGTFYGTPRNLPFVFLCQADVNFCGRKWIVNTEKQYEEAVKARQTHEVLCSARVASAGIFTALGEAEHSGLLVAKR